MPPKTIYLSTFPLFFKSDLGVEKETLSLNVTVEWWLFYSVK